MIEPALSADEWSRRGNRYVETNEDGRVFVRCGSDEVPVLRRHATAALCLDGRPFGFTREDVADERAELAGLEGQLRAWLAQSARQQLSENEKANMAILHERIARKRSRADRIEALLPLEIA